MRQDLRQKLGSAVGRVHVIEKLKRNIGENGGRKRRSSSSSSVLPTRSHKGVDVSRIGRYLRGMGGIYEEVLVWYLRGMVGRTGRYLRGSKEQSYIIQRATYNTIW